MKSCFQLFKAARTGFRCRPRCLFVRSDSNLEFKLATLNTLFQSLPIFQYPIHLFPCELKLAYLKAVSKAEVYERVLSPKVILIESSYNPAENWNIRTCDEIPYLISSDALQSLMSDISFYYLFYSERIDYYDH